MKRYLILKGYGSQNSSGKWNKYPEKFNEINKNIMNKKSYIENEIIKQVNIYNSKLKVSEIRYYNKDISGEFSTFQIGVPCGAILEETTISQSEIQKYKEKNYYVDELNLIAKRILEYVFVLPTVEGSRNIYVAQTVFPALIDYMTTFIDSPSYSIANHKFMLLNINADSISAKAILRPLTAFVFSGMDFVDVFNQSVNVQENRDIYCFLSKYDNIFLKTNIGKNGIYKGKYYEVNFNNKTVYIKRKTLDDSVYFDGQYETFKGSYEKFYWAEVLSFSLLAYRQGYRIDYSEYIDFCDEHKISFSPKNDKIKRCISLGNYFKKIFI